MIIEGREELRNVSGNSQSRPRYKSGLYNYQKLILAAIALSPLQAAFTINVGFPLKISEVLLGLSLSLALLGRRKIPKFGAPHWLFLAFAGTVLSSALIHLLTAEPQGFFPGYTRSLTTDLLLYVGYGILVLLMWYLAVGISPDFLAKSITVGIWVCGFGTLAQWGLSSLGQIDVLELLNFETKTKGLSLDGDSSGVMRSGPFVEGQHLGFFAGAGLVLALSRKNYLTAGIALVCLFYSQSTTGFLGVFAALVVTFMTRPKVGKIVKSSVSVGFIGGCAYLIPEIRVMAQYQLAKLDLFDGNDQYSRADISIDLRSAKSEIGFQIAADNPIIGVGPGRYGTSFFDFATSPPIPSYYFDMATHRALAENVYAQIAAEFGFASLILFVLAIISILILTFKRNVKNIGFIIFIAISITTQSNWIFIPIWAFLAYSSSLVSNGRHDSSKRSSGGPTSPLLRDADKPIGSLSAGNRGLE